MEEEVSKEQQEAGEKLVGFIIQEMKAGSDKSAIAQKLVEMGMETNDASEAVEEVYTDALKMAEAEQLTGPATLRGLIGGVIAALVGGGIWSVVVNVTGYEIGFVAWGIGVIAGFAVVIFSGGRKGVPLQIVAVLSSVLGILAGKYFIFFHIAKGLIAAKEGAAAAANIPLFSERMIQLFLANITVMLSGFDIIWLALAVMTAWRIPKALGLKVPRDAYPPTVGGYGG